MVTTTEVDTHNSRESCWVIIKGNVYDVTKIIDSHPGGPDAILKYAGKDATAAFEPIHPSDTLNKYLQPEQKLGFVSDPIATKNLPSRITNIESKKLAVATNKLSLGAIINIRDFEVAASQRMIPRSFGFFKAGADDEFTTQWNAASWQRIRFRPRVLKPIMAVDLSTTIFGTKFAAPFFICPAGGGKLAHPDGEVLMTKAAAKHDILHWVCNNAGCSQQEMTDARLPGQTTFWQIYAMTDLAVTEKEIKQAVASGYKGFALTVDAIRVGKRERDMRINLEGIDESDYLEENDSSFSGGISVTRPPVWSEFDWVAALKWLRTITDLPIAMKGIQSWEDAALCMHYGVHPWLSNHGGRQLEGAPSAVETLLEIRHNCPEVFNRCEVIVDGGVMRGTDIVKALALGAKAVGLGRPFLYSLVFGEVGVSKAIRILKHEVETAMVLLGATTVGQLSPSYVALREFPKL